MQEERIKLIFGLKLRQKRNEKGISLFELSKLTGLSKSYLNEIENGKKYPKPDKIVILSEQLGIAYDQLVSLKLDQRLAPVGDFLDSNILQDFPLALYGLKKDDLVNIVTNNPLKVNTLIKTIKRITKRIDFDRKDFFWASLRSFKERDGYYFEFYEKAVIQFANEHKIDLNFFNHANVLENLLQNKYGYKIVEDQLQDEFQSLLSVFLPRSSTLVLSPALKEQQKNFIFAKELAFKALSIEDRGHTFPHLDYKRFDDLVHDFYATYFASALIIPYKRISQQLRQLFNHDSFDALLFNDIIQSFNASPDIFYHRMTSILSNEFSFKDLFLIQFEHEVGSAEFTVKEELRLDKLPNAQNFGIIGHHCRRWSAIKVIENLERSNSQHEFDVQISTHLTNENSRYLVFSSAIKDPFKPGYSRGVSIGLLFTAQLKKKINFLNDPKIRQQNVGAICESCPVKDCSERVAPLSLVDLKTSPNALNQFLEKLEMKYN